MKKKKLVPGNNKTARIVITILAVVTVIFIFYNSMKGPEATERQSGKVFMFLQKIFPSITHYTTRKLAHVAEYTFLGLELSFMLRIPTTFSLGLLVAVMDETIQIYSHRGSSVSDIWIDMVGIIIGILIIATLDKLIHWGGKNGS